GNTIAKLANGITDTPVTMAVKATLRNQKPVIIAVSTNDGLSASAKNIGMLLNTKNIYFVPFGQDDCINKKTSLVADMSKIIETTENALDGIQIQPLLF
ncbi:MAG: dipicolinate synthase subunit B, partial [Clostridia bacterium]|nr:dipicolinate synthase subunit B [Clostridia bacterium]